MSIQNQLTHELKRFAEQLKVPSVLDSRIDRLYDTYREAVQRSDRKLTNRRGSRRLARIAVVAACVFLFSGIAYASGLLYQLQGNSVRVELTSSSAFNVKAEQATAIHSFLAETRQQLQPGESAYVYLPELEQAKVKPFLKVVRPLAFTDIVQWNEQAAGKYGGRLQTPTAAPDGFHFTRGELQSPLGMIDPEVYPTLNKQIKKVDGKQAIVLPVSVTDNSLRDALDSPGLVYTNEQQDQIEIRYQVMPEAMKKLDVRMKTGESTTMEKISVKGSLEGYYTMNPNNVFSESGYMQDLNWIEQEGGRTVMYHIQSSSAKVTKADLLLVANHLSY